MPNQSLHIITLVKVIYIIIGEKYENILFGDELIRNLYTNILPKLGLVSIRDLFYYIEANLDLNKSQIEKILLINKENPMLYEQKEVIKLNRIFAYLIFPLKDIIRYISQTIEIEFTQGKEIFYEEVRNREKWIRRLKNERIRVDEIPIDSEGCLDENEIQLKIDIYKEDDNIYE